MTTSVNDAGTWRGLIGVYVNDVGTWREIIEEYVNDSGTWRLVHAGGDAFSLTAGSAIGFYGYSASPSIGSISPTTLGDGKTLAQMVDVDPAVKDHILQISGFSSDPGSSYLISAAANGTTLLAAAASYGYNSGSGTAVWTWTNQSFGFVDGNNYTVVIRRT